MDCIHDDWLTDNVIAFWQEYLEREKLRAYPRAHIVLLRPSMAMLLKSTRDPLSLASALPDFTRTTHIFLPVNDCRRPDQAEGGSHWSLLLVSTLDGVAFHYDSLSPANREEARRVSHHFATLLQRPIEFINMHDTPRQSNGKDCGVFVCLLMQHLLISRLLRANARDKISMSMSGMEVDADGGRTEMRRRIEEQRVEGERRRSWVPLQEILDVHTANSVYTAPARVLIVAVNLTVRLALALRTTQVVCLPDDAVTTVPTPSKSLAAPSHPSRLYCRRWTSFAILLQGMDNTSPGLVSPPPL